MKNGTAQEQRGRKNPGKEQQENNETRKKIEKSDSTKVVSNRTASRPTSSGNSTTSSFRTRKCLIIHDPYFSNFDRNKFSKWFDVELLSFKTLHDVVTSKSLPAKVKEINPEAVFLHAGQTDILNKTDGNTVLKDIKGLIKNLLDHTASKICVSLIIPVLGIPDVNSVIKQVNRELTLHISDLRKQQALKDRLFTSNNDSVSGFITRSVGSYGVELTLNKRGERKLWLHLKDGLNRSLDLIPTKHRSKNTTMNNSNPQRNQRNDD